VSETPIYFFRRNRNPRLYSKPEEENARKSKSRKEISWWEDK